VSGVFFGGPKSSESFVNADEPEAKKMQDDKHRVQARARAQFPKTVIPGSGQLSNAARGEAPAIDGDTVCVSLRALSEKARSGSLAMRADSALAICYGLNFVEGYVIDEANKDIVLYGTNRASRPAIQFDDLCVCILNVWNPERTRYVGGQFPYPFCSLDPLAGAMAAVDEALADRRNLNLSELANRRILIQKLADALGPQQVRIGGISWHVRLAHVMIDADYHMKKVSQGHLIVPGVRSVSRLSIEGQRKSNGIGESFRKILGSRAHRNGASMSRFWFHLDKKHPLFLVADGIVSVERCAMIILTEKQISAADGTLQDGGGDDPNAQAFATELSAQLRLGQTAIREYEDLENLYRLYATLKAIQFRQDEALIALDLNPILNCQPNRIEMPTSLPALANVEADIQEGSNGRREYFTMVCGGASMEVILSNKHFQRSRNRELGSTAQLVLRSRPEKRASCWKP